MPVTLTSPVEGKKVGETYSGEREDWLVANGYAARAGDFDGLHVTDVDATQDPTLAANREAPPVQGGDVDAVEAEDGEAILGTRQSSAAKNVPQVEVDYDNLDPRLEVAPQARLVPAGLEDTDPRVHGTGVLLDGSEYGEDKLRAQVNAQDEAAKPAEENELLQVAPQADPRKAVEKTEEADAQSEASREASAKVLEGAEFPDIPETAANVGEREPVVEQAEAAADDEVKPSGEEKAKRAAAKRKADDQ